jgi:hypothetical protein
MTIINGVAPLENHERRKPSTDLLNVLAAHIVGPRGFDIVNTLLVATPQRPDLQKLLELVHKVMFEILDERPVTLKKQQYQCQLCLGSFCINRIHKLAEYGWGDSLDCIYCTTKGWGFLQAILVTLKLKEPQAEAHKREECSPVAWAKRGSEWSYCGGLACRGDQKSICYAVEPAEGSSSQVTV